MMQTFTKDVKTRFNSLNYVLDRLLPRRKIKKLTVQIKDELGGKIMTEFAALRAKTYCYSVDDGDKKKK